MSFVSQFPGTKNYIKNPRFEDGLTTEWSLGTIGTLTNGLPTGSPTFGSGAAGTLSLSAVSSGQLAGQFSLSLAESSAATTAGNMMATNAYTIDIEDQAKVLTFSCSYKLVTGIAGTNCNFSGTSANSLAYAVWDVTNSVWLTSQGNFNFVQATGVGQCVGTFQTGFSTSQIRICVYFPTATSAAFATYFDTFMCGPQTIQKGPQISDWTAYTPTVSAAFGTATGISFFYRRDGDMLSVQGTFTAGTVAASLATLTLPGGLSIDSSKISINNTSSNPGVMVGYYDNSEATANTQGCIVTAPATSTTLVYFGPGETNASSSLTPANGNVITASSVVLSVNFSVPIAGWSSNTVQSSDTDTKVISFAKNNINAVTAYSSSTVTDLTWASSTVVNDSAGAWNGTYYIIPVSGYYILSTYFIFNSSAYSAGAQYEILWADSSNNTVYDLAEFTGAATTGRVSGGKTIGPIYFNAGQTLKPRMFQAMAATASFQYVAIGINRLSGPAVVTATESVIAEYSDSAGATFAATTVANALTFNTKETDTHSFFNGATGVATAPVSGRYLFVGSIGVYTSGAAPANSYADVILTSSTGVTKTCRQQLLGTANIQELPFMKTFYLQTGQTVTLTKQATYSSGTVSMFAGANLNSISIIRVGN